MLELILLIVGIVFAVRRPRLRKLTAADYPGVDPVRFAEWQQAQLKATDVFLWATWGAFVVKLFLSLVLVEMRLSPEAALGAIGIIVTLWIVGLIVASSFSSKAKKLRTAAGIAWPK